MEDEEKVSNAAIEKQTTEHKNLKKKKLIPSVLQTQACNPSLLGY